jgi:ribosomal protein L2
LSSVSVTNGGVFAAAAAGYVATSTASLDGQSGTINLPNLVVSGGALSFAFTASDACDSLMVNGALTLPASATVTLSAAEGVKPGMTLMSGEKAEATPGNCLPLALIPLGLFVHCVELVPGQGAKVARSAGTEAQIMARDGNTVTLKMASGEVRLFNARCKATVGAVGNKDWGSIHLGKAGRKRYLGIRPTVRGVAMNPVDHPMGGGEGRTSGGSHPRSPWGQLAKGGKTRNPHKASNKVIVKRRK